MIELRQVSKSFRQQNVLDAIDLRIETGAKTCVIGGSGSGKSVTLKLMSGLLEPDAGEIFIDGQSTRGYRQRDWQRLMKDFGVVFQGAALFDSLTVLENVGMRLLEARQLSRAEIRAQVVDALQRVRLEAKILDQYPSELSGGMQKRVAIARAIIHNPCYLFYDEPTTGLDPISAEVIDELIQGLARDEDRTTVIVTHDMRSVALLATQVVMLHENHIIFDGPKAEFFGSDIPEIRAFLRRLRAEDVFEGD